MDAHPPPGTWRELPSGFGQEEAVAKSPHSGHICVRVAIVQKVGISGNYVLPRGDALILGRERIAIRVGTARGRVVRRRR